MADTAQILARARELGQLIAAHPAVKKLEQVIKQLDADVDAQRALTDYNRHMMSLAEKQQNGQPIEVADKQRMETLRQALMSHSVLSSFQMAQMDYLDLMRQVDETIQQEAGPAEAPVPGGAAAAGGAGGEAGGGPGPIVGG